MKPRAYLTFILWHVSKGNRSSERDKGYEGFDLIWANCVKMQKEVKSDIIGSDVEIQAGTK